MSISISQQYAKIGIETKPGSFDIQTEKAELSIHQKHAKVNIKTEPTKVLIDQYECRSTSGMKNLKDLTALVGQMAQQNLMEYLSKKVSEGHELAAIENPGNPLVSIAVRNSTREHEFGMATMPTASPSFQVEGSVNIEWERNWEGSMNGVEYQFQPGKINISYNQGKVDIYVRQMASIDISYQPENKIDVKI